MNLGLIRETLTARLPDAIVPACLQLVWLLACARGLRPLPAGVPAWTAAAAVVVISAASVTIVGTTREQLDRAELLGGFERLQQQFHDRADQLHARFSPQQIPSRVAYALMPFFAYADRCLGQKDHVLVPAFLPEVSVWSRQPFAGGQILFQPGVLASEADHRLVMDRLGTQRVPVAVLHPASDLIAAQFGELAHYIRTHFTELTAFGTGDGPTIRVGFDPRLASGRDSATGWFCYQ